MHAVRNLTRAAFGTARVRWSQLGFGRTSSTSTRPGHAAQPDGVQGRDREPQGRGDGRPRDARLGPAGRRRRPGRVARRRRRTWSCAGSGCRSRPGTGRRSASRRRSSAGPRARARRCRAAPSSPSPTSAARAGTGEPLIADEGPRAARPSVAARRGADPAPRLQLHGRQRLARAARRGAVLRRLRARPADGLHPAPAGARAARRPQRVHRPHRAPACTRSRPACRRSARTGRSWTTRSSARRCSPERASRRRRSRQLERSRRRAARDGGVRPRPIPAATTGCPARCSVDPRQRYSGERRPVRGSEPRSLGGVSRPRRPSDPAAARCSERQRIHPRPGRLLARHEREGHQSALPTGRVAVPERP